MKSALLLPLFIVVVACTPMMSSPQPYQAEELVDSYELTSPQDLQQAKPMITVDLFDGANYTLVAQKMKKTIAGRTITMYGYNGMVPGPLFVAKQNTHATITFVNNLDKDTTVHWHGLRGDYRSDGVPGLGQEIVKPGESFTYTLTFPDEGIYWYHPHVREDAQQDLGLYGNIFVSGLDSIAGRADKDEYIVLDDIELTSTGVQPFGKDFATHAVMGRYGNTLLVNGEPSYHLTVQSGEIVRLYFTNVANARPFNIQIPRASMKLVAGDNGAYLKQQFIDSLTIGPGERYVVDVLFDKPGTYELRADNPLTTHLLGTISVTQGTNKNDSFYTLENNTVLENDVRRLQYKIDGTVDRTLELDFILPGMGMSGTGMQGMMHEADDGIEWEDTMPMMSDVTSDRVQWIIRDTKTGLENSNITLRAKVGDVEKWRITNKADSMHPMQHPIHLHGQRFLVTAIDGKPVENLVWKDVVLVPIGHTADIVVEYTNPGEWMLHCHIAEHLETGMFAYVSVADENGHVEPRIGEEMH